jgi:streptogramin lyase
MNGILRLEPMPGGWQVLEPSLAGRPVSMHIASLAQHADGTLLACTYGAGVVRFAETDTSVELRNTVPRSAMPRGAARMFSIRARKDGSFLVCDNTGVLLLPKELQSLHRIAPQAAETTTRPAGTFDAIEDAHGMIWFEQYGRLFRYDPANGRIDSSNALSRRINGIHKDIIWVFFEDRQRRLWIGMHPGLACFNPADSSIALYSHDPDDPRSLSNDMVRSICQDARGRIYIGTWGGGVNLYHDSSRTFSCFTRTQGLAGDIVSGMLEDHRERLWIATNRGLSRWNRERTSFRTFNPEEIQSIGQFGSHASLDAASGTLFFGASGGLLRFHPDSLSRNRSSAPVVCSQVHVNGAPLQRNLLSGDTLLLSESDHYVSFEFATLDFGDRGVLRYTFKLDGLHTEWIDLGARRECSFSELPFGTYTLHVRGTNTDGSWSDRPLRLTLIVVPPWYRTWWCSSLLIALVFVTAGAGVRRRFTVLRKRNHTERKLLEAELQALRLQINPHFFFNSLNAIQSFVMGNEDELANEYISKFAHLMRMVLESARARTVPLEMEMQMLRLYLDLERIRFDSRFEYRIDVAADIDTTVRIPSMLLQPYAENAVRHGLQHRESGGLLLVSVTQRDDVLFCSIEDNGIGRKRAADIRRGQPTQNSSLGTSITAERIGVLNSLRTRDLIVRILDLHDAQQMAAGTRVEITIPIE